MSGLVGVRLAVVSLGLENVDDDTANGRSDIIQLHFVASFIGLLVCDVRL